MLIVSSFEFKISLIFPAFKDEKDMALVGQTTAHKLQSKHSLKEALNLVSRFNYTLRAYLLAF